MKKIFCLGLIAALSFGTTSHVSAAPESTPIPTLYVQESAVITQPTVKISTKEVIEKQEAFEMNLQIPFSLFKGSVKTDRESKPDSVIVMPTLLSEKNEVLLCDIQLPRLKGMQDEKTQAEINNSFEKRAVDLKEEMAKEGKESLEDAKKYDYEARPYGIFIDYNTSYNEKNILSITSYYYQYTGGAHGMTLTETSNINLKTGKKITLKDLFKEGIDYRSVLTEEIKRQMAADTRFYENAASGLETISEDQAFYIQEDGIVLYYQPYDIAPYAVGTPEFKIPFSLIQDGFTLNVSQ